MPGLEVGIAAVAWLALLVYALSGGADFGGGVWELLAFGPRAAQQRRALAAAIAPIWEANHVWLILVVVLLFVGFPVAFAAIGTALHIPLAAMLVGIVLRGAAFVFRAYDPLHTDSERRWSRVFAIASTVTPVMLGVTLGAVAGGKLHVDVASGRAATDFISAWWTPFPWAVGGFTLTLFAFLAAVYMTVEVADPDLREDFRRRALVAAVCVGAMAWLSFGAAALDAPVIFAGLGRGAWALPFQVVTALVAIGAIVALVRRHYRAARALAVAQVTLVVLGWGAAQYPYVIPPDLDLAAAAAPPSVLRPLLWALVIGGLLVAPSLVYLYRVFKRPTRGVRTASGQ